MWWRRMSAKNVRNMATSFWKPPDNACSHELCLLGISLLACLMRWQGNAGLRTVPTALVFTSLTLIFIALNFDLHEFVSLFLCVWISFIAKWAVICQYAKMWCRLCLPCEATVGATLRSVFISGNQNPGQSTYWLLILSFIPQLQFSRNGQFCGEQRSRRMGKVLVTACGSSRIPCSQYQHRAVIFYPA